MSTILQDQVYTALTTHALVYEELACDASLADTAAFCEAYGFTPEQSANTIIVASKTDPVQFVACVVLADSRLDVNKAVRKLMNAKKVSFATADQTTALTGMLVGGVTIFGLPADIPIYVDTRVMDQDKIVMGGGNRSSKVVLNPNELLKYPGLSVAAISQA